MKISDLKKKISGLPDEMEVFVGCQGYTNFEFEEDRRCVDGETMVIVHEGKLFIVDECAVETKDGTTI